MWRMEKFTNNIFYDNSQIIFFMTYDMTKLREYRIPEEIRYLISDKIKIGATDFQRA